MKHRGNSEAALERRFCLSRIMHEAYGRDNVSCFLGAVIPLNHREHVEIPSGIAAERAILIKAHQHGQKCRLTFTRYRRGASRQIIAESKHRPHPAHSSSFPLARFRS